MHFSISFAVFAKPPERNSGWLQLIIDQRTEASETENSRHKLLDIRIEER